MTADITRRDAVAAGLEGVDALLHAASVYSLDPARAARSLTVSVVRPLQVDRSRRPVAL